MDNGPSEYPGAMSVEYQDGKVIQLHNNNDNLLELPQLVMGCRVARHLQDGDYVAMNRQPSTYKVSIMGHRVRVMRQSTFRLNLASTMAYDVDFDGDMMTLHVPQSEKTKAEVFYYILFFVIYFCGILI